MDEPKSWVDLARENAESVDGMEFELPARPHHFAIESGGISSIEGPTIASICFCFKAVLAIRNVKDFEYLEVDLVNPFE